MILLLVGIGVAAGLVSFLTSSGALPAGPWPMVAYSLIAVFAGLALVRTTATFLTAALTPKAGAQAFIIVKTFRLVGYVVILFVVLGIFQVTAELAIAIATFGGLVIGLALQPILSNFFAGLIVLFTGFLKVEDEVEFITTTVPFSMAALPSYKFFSRDYVYAGYGGRVTDVRIFYTTIQGNDGEELRVPNLVLLNSAVVDKTHRQERQRTYRVRYEFELQLDPDVVEEAVHRSLADMGTSETITLMEQSDKQFFIVEVEGRSRPGIETSSQRSEVLKRLIQVHKDLRSAPARRDVSRERKPPLGET